MVCNLQKNSLSVKKFAHRRFIKRPIGLDGTQKFDGLSRTFTAVFLTIIDLCREDLDGVYYSHDSIAKRAECSRRSVVKALGALKDRGYVDWVSRGTRLDPKTGKPRNLTNKYWLTEKLLHVLPYDCLTGEERDVEAEEKILPVLAKPVCVQKDHRILREELRSNSTLEPADAGVQKAAPMGLAVEGVRDGSGVDYDQSVLESKTLKKPSGRVRRATADDSKRKMQVPIHPVLRDQAIQILSAYRLRLAQKGYPADDVFFTHQYPQLGVMIEMTGSHHNAIRLVEYVVDHWKELPGSTGPSDAEKLPATPNLNNMLPHWRIKTWWARCRGIQTNRSLIRRTKAIEAREKFKREKARLGEMVAELQAMATGLKPFDASRFDFRSMPSTVAKPDEVAPDLFAKWGR